MLPPHPLSSQTRADDERGRGGKRERERVCERENLLLLLYFLLPCCKLNVQREWEREIRVDGAPRVPTHRLSKSIFSVLNKNRKTPNKRMFHFYFLRGHFFGSKPNFYGECFSVDLKGALFAFSALAISYRDTRGPDPIKIFSA